MQGFRIAASGQLLPVTQASPDLERVKAYAAAWLNAHPGTTDAVLIYTRSHGTHVATVQRGSSGSVNQQAYVTCGCADGSPD